MKDLKHVAVFSSHGMYELLRLKRPKNWKAEKQSSGNWWNKTYEFRSLQGKKSGEQTRFSEEKPRKNQMKAKKESKIADILQ